MNQISYLQRIERETGIGHPCSGDRLTYGSHRGTAVVYLWALPGVLAPVEDDESESIWDDPDLYRKDEVDNSMSTEVS